MRLLVSLFADILKELSMSNTDNELVSLKENETKPQKDRTYLMLYSGHLGKILSNVAILFTIITAACLSTSLISFLVMVVLMGIALIMLMGIVVTIGTILAIIPGYWSALVSVWKFAISGASFSSEVIYYMTHIWPYTASIAVLFSAVSIVFLCLDKTDKHTNRIVTSSVVLGITVIAIILLLIGIAQG